MSEQKYLSDSGLQRVWTKIKTLLNLKVDKVAGKGLSTNDYTTVEKNKLAGIATGAEVNVQSDWEQTNTTAKDFIKNKPNLTSLLAGKVDNQYNPIYSGKVLGIDNTGAVVPVTGGGGGGEGSIGLYSVTLSLTATGYAETTIEDDSVTADMKVLEWFTNIDDAQSDDWSITTDDGEYTFVGTIKTAPAVLTVIFGTDGTNVLQEVTQIEQIIGDTALPTTAQTLTGAVAELSDTKADKSDLSFSETGNVGSLAALQTAILNKIDEGSGTRALNITTFLSSAFDPFETNGGYGIYVYVRTNTYFSVLMHGYGNSSVVKGSYKNGSWVWTKLTSTNLTLLFDGSTNDLSGNTTYQLQQSYANFTHLYIVTHTNYEASAQMIPISTIANPNYGVEFSHFGGNTTGVQAVSSWPYCAWLRVSFPSATTFITVGGYTTSNLTLKVRFIYGLNL